MKIELLIYKLLNDRKLQLELGLLLIFSAIVVLAYSVSGPEMLDHARVFLGGPQVTPTGELAPVPHTVHPNLGNITVIMDSNHPTNEAEFNAYIKNPPPGANIATEGRVNGGL